MNETLTDRTGNVTEDSAREYLAGRGYDTAQVAAVLDEARRFPCRYAYTADRYAWAVHHMPAGSWQAGDSTATEKHLATLRAARAGGWRRVT